MNREPDWQALNQLNFLLAPRIGGALNEALNALSLAEMSDSTANPQIWRDKAKAIIANLLNLYNAWTALIQYKNGFKLPPTLMRPFHVQALLDWLTIQLELVPPAKARKNTVLNGNQACIQEALWLLYTVGYTQGTGVHLLADPAGNGYWFRIRFSRRKPLPNSLDELIEQFNKHWREQDAAFELRVARDFIQMNNGKLEVRWNEQNYMGEFAFFIYQAGARQDEAPQMEILPDAENARSVANITRSMMRVSLGSGDTTLVMPPDADERETAAVALTSDIKKALAEVNAEKANKVDKQPEEGVNKTAAIESQDPTNKKESAPVTASEAKARDVEDARGTKLLQELIELDRQRKGGLVDSEEDLPTAEISLTEIINDLDDKRATKTGEPRIISVKLPDPEIPPLLKELPESETT